jgi:hypothetical protein
MDKIKSLSSNLSSNIMSKVKSPSLKIPSIKTPSLKTPSVVKNTLSTATKSVSSIVNIKDLLIIFGIFIFLVAISMLLILSGISFKKATKLNGDAYILEGINEEHEDDIVVMKKKQDDKNCVGLSKDIDKYCKSQQHSSIGGREKCGGTSCCVWLEKNNNMSDSMCIQGDKNGPLNKALVKKLGVDEYYYQNKKKKIIL